MGPESDDIKKAFHGINNWLNKITMNVGQTRYELQIKGLDSANLEGEKNRLIELLKDVEEYAMMTGQMLKELRKRIKEG